MRNGNRKTEELSAEINLGLLAGVERRPFFTAHGVDQHHAGDVFGVEERIAAHHQAAEGMPDQNVGRLDAGALQHIVQFHGDVAGGADGAAWAAPAEAAAIVGCGAGKAGDGLLNVKPVQIGGGDAGFKEHGRAARAFFEQVEAVTRALWSPSALGRQSACGRDGAPIH